VPGFDSIIDQERPIRILTSLLVNGTIPHALLFTGIEGVGKKTAAVALAMACNCTGGEAGTAGAGAPSPGAVGPCGECAACRKIVAGAHPDMLRVSPAGAMIKIDQIRELCQVLTMKPYEARVRVVIIADAHTLNPAAGNALLKMLEEPPARTALILTAPQTGDLLPTIVSRCQHIRFKPIARHHLAAILTRAYGVDPPEASLTAALAGGSLTRALAMRRSQWLQRRSWLMAQLAALPRQSMTALLALAEKLSQARVDSRSRRRPACPREPHPPGPPGGAGRALTSHAPGGFNERHARAAGCPPADPGERESAVDTGGAFRQNGNASGSNQKPVTKSSTFNMIKIVGVRFKPAGKVYDFDCGAYVLNPGDQVMVETEQGLSLGSVVAAPKVLEDPPANQAFKKIYRLAAPKDLEQLERKASDERAAHALGRRCIRELGLKMNLFAVEKSFDGSRMTFFFTAEGRVDFRQLLKMLVKELGARIEMRQVGIRNQSKMCGGLGRCGREFCCASYLEKFEPVSIRMAKEQSLSLNPTKISGQCGRLMCCLIYEYDTYMDLKKGMPRIGAMVKTPSGTGKVVRQNAICNRLVVRLEDGMEIEVSVDKIQL
jgi:DNA polymerase III delta' subunit